MARTDYSRFFVLLKKHPHVTKEEIVSQFTDGRTTSLREMRREEFDQMCDTLQYGTLQEREARELQLKRSRSAALLRLGRLGINTIDNWDGINSFCESPKIAGKKFYDLSVPELRTLVQKLESIIRKGGLKALDEPERKISDTEVESILKLANINSNSIKS